MTLVDVEFEQIDWPESRTRTLLSEINACLHPDRIRVRQRSAAERGIFLTALDARHRARVLPAAVWVS